MTPLTSALVAILSILAWLGVGVYAVSSLKSGDEWYEEGWEDCAKAHHHFGMTPDDELVLKHLKLAFKAYIKEKGYRRRGDVKKLDRAENFDDFRHIVWEICELRRSKR